MPEKHRANRGKPKNVLRLPDLDHSRASVLQSLGSVASKRTYAFAINDFIAGTAPNHVWHLAEPSCFGVAMNWRPATWLRRR